MSGLISPILEQAGFLKRKAAVVVEQWVAQLDGAAQFWQLTSPIALEIGDEVLFHAAKDAGAATSKQWFASGSGLRINVQANNKIEEVGGDLYLDGDLVTNYVTDFPTGGIEHTLSYVITSQDRALSNLGASESGFEKLSGYIKKLTIKRNGVVIHEIPLTNKAQGATQLATIGNINAFMPNYTDAVWRKP